ncbi:MAG: transglutaminase-like domain-containing protein [Cyclobacteriaceae bacterium]
MKGILAIAYLYAALNLCANGQPSIERLYMAIELNNVLCGYSEITISDSTCSQGVFKSIEQNVYISFHILGKDITQYQKFRYLIDPESGNFIFHDSYHEQGEMVFGNTVVVEGDSLVILTGEKRVNLFIPENTILPNNNYYPYLLKDFGKDGIEEHIYQVYDFRSGGISSRTYKSLGTESLKLSNRTYQSLVLEESNPDAGPIAKLWICENTGMRLRMESPQRLTMYLSDESVKDKIKTGNWDEILFIKTNASIKDLKNIRHMKVRVDLVAEPNSTIQDLNVPGQVFTGSVEEGEIRGICEIAHERYDGMNAPFFPFKPNPEDKIDSYLEASNNIESDDPVLVDKASRITEGSENAWEAACRISHWVAENIEGSIIDGSARDTYDRGSGLCGAQSYLMAAMCRAAGIPSRVVWGCMYTPKDGGSFGHHAWNEVFMGDNGWIPVDVTIHETDYVDSGHIRLGVLNTPRTSIDYREIEILEYNED